MYHISVNLAISRRDKIFGGTKSSNAGVAKKAIRGRQKIVPTFLLFFKTLKFLWGCQKTQQRASNGNFTPLDIVAKFHNLKLCSKLLLAIK